MPYAGFWQRFIANFIDGLILLIPSALASSTGSLPTSFGFGIILGILYKPVFESSALMGTPGKAILGLVVENESGGGRITFKTALVRYFSSYISTIMLYVGYLMQPFTSKRQTLHDMIAETVVLKKDTLDLNYFVVWRDQLKDIASKL